MGQRKNIATNMRQFLNEQNITDDSMENRLLDGEVIELANDSDSVTVKFQERTNNFSIMLNGKVIKATKTWKPIEDKLKTFDDLSEEQ